MTTEVVSPELALVCPDLRAAAIAGLPQREPDAWLDRPWLLSTAPEYDLMAALAAGEPPRAERTTPLAVALVAYTATSAARFALEAALFVGIMIGLLSVITVAHP